MKKINAGIKTNNYSKKTTFIFVFMLCTQLSFSQLIVQDNAALLQLSTNVSNTEMTLKNIKKISNTLDKVDIINNLRKSKEIILEIKELYPIIKNLEKLLEADIDYDPKKETQKFKLEVELRGLEMVVQNIKTAITSKNLTVGDRLNAIHMAFKNFKESAMEIHRMNANLTLKNIYKKNIEISSDELIALWPDIKAEFSKTQ